MSAEAEQKLLALQADADSGHPKAIAFCRALKLEGIDVESIKLVSLSAEGARKQKAASF